MSSDVTPLTGRGWLADIASVGPGKSGHVSANDKECAAVAAALDLISCTDFTFEYALKPMSRYRFRLHATLRCKVVQACVVTLEAVPSGIEESSDSELVPEEDATAAAPPDEAMDVLSAPVIDTYAQGKIDLGRIAFELLSVSLDPYPKAPGAVLPDDTDANHKALSPFAELARLRKDPNKT